MTIKIQLKEDMKSAMKARESQRLSAIRLVLAQIKQQEVDNRVELLDNDVIAILDKMCKQRRESIAQYQQASREDLVAKEQFELDIISAYLPAQLSAEELEAHVKEAITSAGASSMRDMGNVMATLKPLLQGKADMSLVSQLVKQHLA